MTAFVRTELAPAAEKHLHAFGARCTRSTLLQRRKVLARFTRFVIGRGHDRDVLRASAEDLVEYVASLSPSLQRYHTGQLRSFYRWALAEQLIDTSPAARAFGDRGDGASGPERKPPGAALSEHLASLRHRGYRDGSIDQREWAIKSLAKFLLGRERGLLDAEYADLGAFVAARAPHSLEYRANLVGHLRMFYRWAYNEELIVVDPAARLEGTKRRHRVVTPIPTPDLRFALQAAASNATVRLWLLLAAFCGLRDCEIATVRREDVSMTSDGPIVVVVDGKNGKDRVIPCPDVVFAALDDPALPRSRGYLFPKGAGDPSRRAWSGPISANALQIRANRFLRDLGISHRMHSLRKWYGTHVYAQTLDLVLASELLGHADIRTTKDHYVALRPSEDAYDVVTGLSTQLDAIGGGSQPWQRSDHN